MESSIHLQRYSIDSTTDRGLQHAVVQAKLDGLSCMQILTTFIGRGFQRSEIVQALSGSLEYLSEQNHRLALQLDRYEQIFSIFSTLTEEDPSGLKVCQRFPQKRFFTDFYAKNKPLVIRGAAKKMRACKRWSAEYLSERFGHIEIKAAIGRNKYSDPEGNLSRIEKRIKLRDFLKLIDSANGNDAYMVARNHNLMNPELTELILDLQPLPACISSPPSKRQTHLWIGPKGTLTPFHFDKRNILFFQVSGQKRFTLASPLSAPYMYNHYSVFSEVDPEQPDFNRHPLFRHVKLFTVDLDGGDALFLPVAWWHQVRSLSPSISVGISDFIYQNEFSIRS